ncbi:hypothetical protein HJFPF1_02253 [Paramyrothecium foliicola]|nr:hypothetical protein HJFPF1_02253 [Paramyrothecium foliicola]
MPSRSGLPCDNDEFHADLVFSQSKATLAAGDATTIQVTATQPRGLPSSRYPFWSGYILVSCSDGSALSLSYQDLSASLHNATVIKDNGAWLARVTDLPTLNYLPGKPLPFLLQTLFRAHLNPAAPSRLEDPRPITWIFESALPDGSLGPLGMALWKVERMRQPERTRLP